MIQIAELESAGKEQINQIADLHKKAFPTFFLTQLGLSFLKALYYGYIEDKESGIIIAEKNGSIVGFIAYSNDYPRFFKELIRHHLLKFAVSSVWAALRHPSYAKRLFGAFKKSQSVVKEEKYVELASICVDPETENNGIGSCLINYLKDLVDFNKFAYTNLETDADNNEKVNFYLKNGFSIVRVAADHWWNAIHLIYLNRRFSSLS